MNDKKNEISEREVSEELTEMAKEFYVAEVANTGNSFRIKFLNGQTFTVSVQENK